MIEINDLIKILNRVNNCDKIYMNLLRARDNRIFEDQSGIDEVKIKWIMEGLYPLIDESIKMIEKE
jgi:hypothetical protein